MKKLIALLMICALCVCFAACDTAEATPAESEPTTQPTEANTEPFDWNLHQSSGSSCAIEDYSSSE